MMSATLQQAMAKTVVFWDIKKCPVPRDFDAHGVGPRIKRFLKKLGYSGPVTIFATGRLLDVPCEVLRAISSTGIVLEIAPYGSNSVQSSLFSWTRSNLPPANIMVITDPTNKSRCLDLSMLRRYHGYNIIYPYPFRPARTGINAECVWESFLRAESGALEEDKYSIETGESASWFCSVCPGDPSGQGFENFTTHIVSQEHAQERLRWLASKRAEAEDKNVVEVEEAVVAGVEPQPQTWEWVSPADHFSATPSECPPMVMHQPKLTWERSPRDPHMYATPSEPHEKEALLDASFNI